MNIPTPNNSEKSALIVPSKEKFAVIHVVSVVESCNAATGDLPNPYPREVLGDYRRRIREFARERNLEVVDFVAEADLRPEDFADECHVRRLEAVERCTSRLEDHLAAHLARVIEREASR